MIAAIRAIDPDNLIVVGTPSWSQDVDAAAADPITGTNIAYALHFYAGTHGQSCADKAQKALDRGAALFVTEWGAVNANGDGAVTFRKRMRGWNFSKCTRYQPRELGHRTTRAKELPHWCRARTPPASWHASQLSASGALAKKFISGGAAKR